MPWQLHEHAHDQYHEYKYTIGTTSSYGLVGGAACIAAAALAFLVFQGNCNASLVAGVAIAAAACVIGYTACQVVSESIVVLKCVGILLVSQQRCGSSSSIFLDIQDIHSVIIHETLTTTDIHTHLAFLMYSSSELAIAFPKTAPGLQVLVPLYRQLCNLHEVGVSSQNRERES